MDIYITKGIQQIGPFSEEEIYDRIQSGFVRATDLAWCEGLSDWVALAQMLDLAPIVDVATSFSETQSTTDLPETASDEQERFDIAPVERGESVPTPLPPSLEPIPCPPPLPSRTETVSTSSNTNQVPLMRWWHVRRPFLIGCFAAPIVFCIGVVGVISAFKEARNGMPARSLGTNLDPPLSSNASNPSDPPVVEIISATYGTGGKNADVTKRVKQLVEVNRQNFSANPQSLGADPNPFWNKSLLIIYTTDGVRHQQRRNENETILLESFYHKK